MPREENQLADYLSRVIEYDDLARARASTRKFSGA